MFDAQPDGSLLYDEPTTVKSPHWRLAEHNPRLVIPLIKVCEDRVYELRTLKCGKRRCRWWCKQYRKYVGFTECETCLHRPGPNPTQ